MLGRLRSSRIVLPFLPPFPTGNIRGNFMAWSMWTSPSDSETSLQWTRECWEVMSHYLVAGAYGNYVTDDGESIAREAYGAKYDSSRSSDKQIRPHELFTDEPQHWAEPDD